MKTELRAPVELMDISIFAELAVWEPRPELQRLCRAAEEKRRLDADLVASVLPGLSASACRNLLRTVEYLRLTSSDGVLTELGKRCAKTGEAPAWELGVYTFLVARHPCFDVWPVAFRREPADGQDRDFSSLEELPGWFTPKPNESWVSAFEDGTRFTIAAFPSRPGQNAAVRIRSLPPATLVWALDLASGKNRYHVEGHVEGAGALRTTDMMVPEREVTALFGQWERRWNAAAGRVMMPYDGGADNSGRDSFVRTLHYKKVGAGQRGAFELAKVEGVPVGPSSPQEARSWALALALASSESLGTFVTPSAWKRAWEQVIAGSPLQSGAGAAPDSLTVLEQSRTLSPRLRWLLAAPADLSLE